MAPAADPGEAPAADQLDHHRQQRRVADAPHEARAHDDRLEAIAVGGHDGLLGARLGRAVEGGRVGAQRRRLVDVDERLAGEQRRLGADVDEAAHAGVGAGPQCVARALDVAALEVLPPAPVAEHRGRVKCELAALGAGAHRRDVREVARARARRRAR